jgi:hypothetical protein
VIDVIIAAALAACPYGTWDAEVVQITAIQNTQWQYRELKPNEQKKIADRYYADLHGRIDYPHASTERLAKMGLTQYAVIFTDDARCIQFRLNATGARANPAISEPIPRLRTANGGPDGVKEYFHDPMSSVFTALKSRRSGVGQSLLLKRALCEPYCQGRERRVN